jgi:CDGSH-type Zn-finger protein
MSKIKITINNNGPLKVEGEVEIIDAQGNTYGLDGRTTVSLCRCGLSKNMPFCDGSHKGVFEHESVAFNLPPRKV